jgi:multidrug efflux pump
VVSKSFLRRPVLALAVLLAVILAAGIIVLTLAVRQYLQAPLPTLVVSTTYPGANAQTVADTVAGPIEREVTGVEGLAAMSRECTDDGAYRLTMTFRRGTDLKVAQVVVQNRVNLAYPVLPQPVKLNEVRVIRQETR